MKNNAKEDLKDMQEVKKQKEEQELSKEDMATWEPGNGVKKKEKNKSDIWSQIQQEGGKSV